MLKPATRQNYVVEDARVQQQDVAEDVRVVRVQQQVVEDASVQQPTSSSPSDSEDENVVATQQGPRVTSLFEALDEDDEEDIVLITDDGITTTADMDDMPPSQRRRTV